MLNNIYKTTLLILSLAIALPACAQTETQIVDFSKAAKFDDVSEVRALLAAGVNPNAKDSKGTPMLVLAVRDKSMKVTEFLLSDKRIDVNLANAHGETPLMLASIEGDLPIVKLLIERNKAKLDHSGWTPLHYACAKGQLEVAQYLVSRGAEVNSRSPNGSTPLMMAAQAGNEELIKFLLSKGADIRMRNSQGLSVIDIAEIYQKPWVAEGLKSRWQKLYDQPYPGPQKYSSSL